MAENLDSVLAIAQNASWQQQALQSPHLFRAGAHRRLELSSIRDIVGDYGATLAECERLITENPGFQTHCGARHNVQWNVFVRPKVEALQKRLSAHNAKLIILLKPLELSLLSELHRSVSAFHRDLSERLDAVHQSILHIQGLLIPDVSQAIHEQEQRMEIVITIPDLIETKFLAAAARSHPEVRQPTQFPLKLGADAFIAHFEGSTRRFESGRFLTERTPSIDQYLNLLKCVWILRRLENSEALAGTSQVDNESQWPGYIGQLHENLYVECQRFSARSAQKLLAPDMRTAFEDSKYAIWVEEDLAAYLSPLEETILPPVLEIPLLNPQEWLSRRLSIHPISQTRYKLVESIQDVTSPEKKMASLRFDIDLKTVSCIPIYALPSNTPVTPSVKVGDGSNYITLEFSNIKWLYRLQHFLTGYKVYDRYDKSGVKTNFIISEEGQIIQGIGRVQLWLPMPFKTVHPGRGCVTGASRLPHESRTHSLDTLDSSPQLRSSGSESHGIRHSSSISASSSSAATGEIPIPIATKSCMSSYTSSSATSRGTASTVTRINTGGPSKVLLHSEPLKPLLVIFFKANDSPGSLSVMAVQIDDATNVERERCSCWSANSKCQVSCLERAGGHLIVQRWEAGDDLSRFNIAKSGMDSGHHWSRVSRLSLNFDNWESKYTALSC